MAGSTNCSYQQHGLPPQSVHELCCCCLSLLQSAKPKHVVHVHHPLPLQMVALGADGEYLIQSRVTVHKSTPGTPADNKRAVQWGDNLPKALQAALIENTSSVYDLDIAAFGKSWGDKDLWYVQADDGDRYPTWIGPSFCNTVSVDDIAQVARNVADESFDVDDLEWLANVCFAPDKGWYVLHLENFVVYQGLPPSLDAALTQYREAYGGVCQLSVGVDGEWFVKYNDTFCQWEGVHPVLDVMLRKRHKTAGKPVWVELCLDKTFVAQFDTCTVLNGSEDLTAALLNTVAWQDRGNAVFLADYDD